MNTENELLDILQDYLDFPVSELDRGLPLAYAAAMSSFTFMHMVAALEESFSIRIPNTDLAELRSADDLLAYLQRRLNVR